MSEGNIRFGNTEYMLAPQTAGFKLHVLLRAFLANRVSLMLPCVQRVAPFSRCDLYGDQSYA